MSPLSLGAQLSRPHPPNWPDSANSNRPPPPFAAPTYQPNPNLGLSDSKRKDGQHTSDPSVCGPHPVPSPARPCGASLPSRAHRRQGNTHHQPRTPARSTVRHRKRRGNSHPGKSDPEQRALLVGGRADDALPRPPAPGRAPVRDQPNYHRRRQLECGRTLGKVGYAATQSGLDAVLARERGLTCWLGCSEAVQPAGVPHTRPHQPRRLAGRVQPRPGTPTSREGSSHQSRPNRQSLMSSHRVVPTSSFCIYSVVPDTLAAASGVPRQPASVLSITVNFILKTKLKSSTVSSKSNRCTPRLRPPPGPSSLPAYAAVGTELLRVRH